MHPWWSPQAHRVGRRHVQVFVPAVDRDGEPVPRGQAHWVEQCLRVLGTHFGGATAFPPSRGVWRDDERGGGLVFEETVIVFAYVSEDDLTGAAGKELLAFVMDLGRTTNQGEVGIFVDGAYYGFRQFDDSDPEPEGEST